MGVPLLIIASAASALGAFLIPSAPIAKDDCAHSPYMMRLA